MLVFPGSSAIPVKTVIPVPFLNDLASKFLLQHEHHFECLQTTPSRIQPPNNRTIRAFASRHGGTSFSADLGGNVSKGLAVDGAEM